MDFISEQPPYAVERPVMYQNWESLTVHWRLEADRLAEVVGARDCRIACRIDGQPCA